MCAENEESFWATFRYLMERLSLYNPNTLEVEDLFTEVYNLIEDHINDAEECGLVPAHELRKLRYLLGMESEEEVEWGLVPARELLQAVYAHTARYILSL